jgi:oligopeptidase B
LINALLQLFLQKNKISQTEHSIFFKNMKHYISLFAAACVLVCTHTESVAQSFAMKFKVNLTPMPTVEKKAKELVAHDDKRIDNYYWLNDPKNPEVINYLNAENSYRETVMEHTKPLQDKLFKEITGRINQTDMSVPYLDNGYMYYVRYEQGKEYPIYCRKKGTLENKEEILLNVNEMAVGHKYYSVGGLTVSPDNKRMVFGVDTVSRRQYTLMFKNLVTGEISKEEIINTTGGAVWANDNRTVFYTMKDPETLRSDKIKRHTTGIIVQNDEVVFEEKDETFNTYVYKTKSEKYIIIGSQSTVSTEFQILDADQPTDNFKVFQPRKRDLEYGIDHFENKFYIVTNLNAKNFRLMECPTHSTTTNNWKEVIPNREDVLLEGIEIFEEYYVLQERKEGITNLRVKSWDGHLDYPIELGEQAYMITPSINPVFESEVIRFSYTSLTTPSSVYDYNMRTHETKLLKQQEVVGGYDQSQYKSERKYAITKDGAKVPISIVYKKTTKLDGTAPCLLYAYGSYGYSMDPTFALTRLSLLDRGFVFAIAHIRGGQEMGRFWYEDGKLLKKKNTFTDFIDCGQTLIDLKYTSKEKLCAQGGSAGGLLMGAVVNMRPDMFKGIIAQVPFVDVVTTMLDETIPLTTGEFDEWGNPKTKEYYDYMKSYSPYDNVVAKSYPSMLVTTGLHDSQVQYFEPAKWVAKLRELKTDKNPLLMYCNMDTGHGGASGRFERYHEVAMTYAFLLDLLDIKE